MNVYTRLPQGGLLFDRSIRILAFDSSEEIKFPAFTCASHDHERGIGGNGAEVLRNHDQFMMGSVLETLILSLSQVSAESHFFCRPAWMINTDRRHLSDVIIQGYHCSMVAFVSYLADHGFALFSMGRGCFVSPNFFH